jgi:hypothetical protein
LKNNSVDNSHTNSNNKQEQRVFNSRNVVSTSIVIENNFQMTFGFLIVVQVATSVSLWKGKPTLKTEAS